MATANTANAVLKSTSKTVTDTLVGEHQHQIVGYSLIKGIGDGEPIASERFTVGGHEWVLLFYPDGKRSSSSEGHGNGAGDHAQVIIPMPHGQGGHQGIVVGVPPHPQGAQQQAGNDGDGIAQAQAPAAGGNGVGGMVVQQQAAQHAPPGGGAVAAAAAAAAAVHHHAAGQPVAVLRAPAPQQNNNRRDTTNEYAALFVALIGEGPNPQGVVSTSDGKVVRAFHRFTLVDQTGQGRDLTKGRTRDAGAVKISCARQDPNARNCHGYRKFVKRSILEDPARGFLVNDTIIIKYTIELVVSSGGALSRGAGGPSAPPRSDAIRVPPTSLGTDLGVLLTSGEGTDCEFVVEEEVMKCHKIVLEARSPVFKALLTSPMREGQEGRVNIQDIRAPVFRALLHFVYTDTLPEEMEGAELEVAMAQHLLVAADQYQLNRLRRICERRLCESVDVETVGTTLTLAEQNHAEELKRVCLEFVSLNLQAVMATDGYRHMCRSCPQLQAEILQVMAQRGPPALPAPGGGANNAAGGAAGAGQGGAGVAVVGGSGAAHRQHVHARGREHGSGEEDGRRVRPRRE